MTGLTHYLTTHVPRLTEGRQTPGSLYTALWDYEFTNTYDNGVKLVGSTKHPRGLKFVGDDGWLFVEIHGGRLEASKKDILKAHVSEMKVQLGRNAYVKGEYRYSDYEDGSFTHDGVIGLGFRF